MSEEKRVISIYAEASPNPESMKFVANLAFLPEGLNVDYENKEAADKAPLAQELFDFSYITRVFVASNFISVTKTPETQWVEVISEIRTYMKQYLEAAKPVFTEMPEKPEPKASSGGGEGSDLDNKIIELLDTYVRPAVEGDGGNIQFVSFEEGIVTVELQGSCSGCPSSTVTLKSGIENLLKRMMPEVKEVRAEGVPDMYQGPPY